MEIIEQIGSYAGLAAIVGLALLSALYFSQARDVRRLREGQDARGPDPVSEQPAQPPGPKRPTAATVPAHGAAAAPAAREGLGADAEPQGRPAPVAAQSAPDEDEDDASDAGAARPAAATANSAGPVADPSTRPDQAPSQTQVGSQSAQGGNAGRPAPRPMPPRLPSPRPGATAAALRSASAPSTTGARPPWYRSLPPRYLALIVAGVVVMSAGAVYAVAELTGEGASSTEATSDEPDAGDTAAPLDPSTITVAVLNGTDVAGLAGQIADSVEAAGFQRGNVSNAPEQGGTAESAVLFADGARRAARQVGQELGIPQIEPLDEQSRSLAGAADVVVIVGADQAD